MQSCDLVLVTKLMISNTSQQKGDSFKGVCREEADKDSVSPRTQSEIGHNYQHVNADPGMLPTQPSGHLNRTPFRNERAGQRAGASAREQIFSHFSLLNKHCQPTCWGSSEKNLSMERRETRSEPVFLCLSVCTSVVAINNTHESQRKCTISLETQSAVSAVSAAAGVPTPVPERKSNWESGGGKSTIPACHRNANGPFFPVHVGKENCPARLLTSTAHWSPEAPPGPGYSL